MEGKSALADFASIKHGFAFEGQFFSSQEKDYVLLTPGNFHVDQKLYFGSNTKYYDGPVPNEYILENGDLLVVMTDLTKDMVILGNAIILESSKQVLHNQRIGKVQLLSKDIDQRYLCYLLNSNIVKDYVKATASGTTVRHTSPSKILAAKHNFPPLPEQQKIAQILSTWDKAIEKLEALIAAKQKRKKALMQQLLTGKRRFAGFEGEWKWIRFDQILDIEIGGTPSRNNPDYWDKEKASKNRWLSIRDIKGRVIEDTKEYITDLGVKKSNVTLIPAGSIVMSFKLTIGRAAILGKDCYTNEAICSLIPKGLNIVVTEFLIQALDIINFEQEIDQAIKGKTLNKAKLGRLKINLPFVEEQQHIAAILSAADKEIENHQKQLTALKQQKKALMQQLLTGKKRVRV